MFDASFIALYIETIGAYMNKRQIKILEVLSEHKKVDVNELSKLCHVSAVTIRKDLDVLEQRDLLKREHGFAIVNNEDNINYRLAFGYQEKYDIAMKALPFVEPNETIFIESGSSCTLLALQIAKLEQHNTIITNSTFIARYLNDYPLTKVIILGGEYQSSSQAIVGPLLRDCIKNFHASKLFIGTDGIDDVFGFTGSDYDRCEAVKIMREQADQLFVLSQSYKLHKHSSYSLFALEDADYLISDDNMSREDIVQLEKHHIRVI